MKVYVASPLGFSECGRDWMYRTFIPAVESCGVSVVDPWKLTPEEEVQAAFAHKDEVTRLDALRDLNQLIGKRNADGIRAADGIVAVLDGVDVDSGTASEIGFGVGLGKWAIGYRGDFRLAGDNPGAIVNLQVEYFIRQSGGTIASTLPDLKQELQARST